VALILGKALGLHLASNVGLLALPVPGAVGHAGDRREPRPGRSLCNVGGALGVVDSTGASADLSLSICRADCHYVEAEPVRAVTV
jgi:hypothetical protein